MVIILMAFVALNGCSIRERDVFPGEENIQPYIQKVLSMGEIPNFDYSPSIEDLFINAFKVKMFDLYMEDLKLAMSADGLLADKNCIIYLPISQLASICDGKTRLYIDRKLINEFNSNDKKGKSYFLLGEALNKRIMDYVLNSNGFPDSIRGKQIYTRFYMKQEDWLSAVADKDPFKYLCLDVYIE